MRCETCNHDNKESEPHKLGECNKCNCGQSEIKHPLSPLARYFQGRDSWGYGRDGGKRVLPAKQI
jgi:hypothetical protein